MFTTIWGISLSLVLLQGKLEVRSIKKSKSAYLAKDIAYDAYAATLDCECVSIRMFLYAYILFAVYLYAVGWLYCHCVRIIVFLDKIARDVEI